MTPSEKLARLKATRPRLRHAEQVVWGAYADAIEAALAAAAEREGKLREALEAAGTLLDEYAFGSSLDAREDHFQGDDGMCDMNDDNNWPCLTVRTIEWLDANPSERMRRAIGSTEEEVRM